MAGKFDQPFRIFGNILLKMLSRSRVLRSKEYRWAVEVKCEVGSRTVASESFFCEDLFRREFMIFLLFSGHQELAAK